MASCFPQAQRSTRQPALIQVAMTGIVRVERVIITIHPICLHLSRTTAAQPQPRGQPCFTCPRHKEQCETPATSWRHPIESPRREFGLDNSIAWHRDHRLLSCRLHPPDQLQGLSVSGVGYSTPANHAHGMRLIMLREGPKVSQGLPRSQAHPLFPK